jgi:NAD(P)-dependent dehydrogenase (short-subunit alcohol dehydrogenase family)
MTALLQNKVAVITGASRGLGLAIARAYTREGASVVLAARAQASVDRVVQELTAQGKPAAGLACDVSDPQQVERLARLAEERFGRIDIWVNNAGVSAPYGPTPWVQPDDFLKTCQTNIFGTYHGSMTALKRFQKQGSGKLINLLGAGSDRSAPNQNAYGSSKIWIRWFSTALAKEIAGSGIEVMQLQPGLMLTSLITNIEVVAGYSEKMKPFETVQRILAVQPEYSAEKAVWLASSATDGKNGLSVKAVGTGRMLSGALRELFARLSGKKFPSTLKIREIPRYQ